MWTQRDQIQAYQFLRRRLVSALVSADANHPVSPAKRLVLGTALGLAAALLVAAVFGIIGALTPSRAQEWRQGGQVIVEKETGARFVLGADDALHPVLNYTSARLLAGADGTKTVTVPAKTLAGVPRGAGVGILGAPDSLPQANRLLTGPWTRCIRTSPDRPAADGPIATVLLGQSASGTAVAKDQGILVRLPASGTFLLAGGHRYRLADEQTMIALGYAAREPVQVTSAWLNTVQAGPPLHTIDVTGAGSPGPTVGGATTLVGQVLVSGAEEYYLVRHDRLEVITQTEALLVLGSPGAAAAYPNATPDPVRVAAADIARARREPARDQGYPRKVPALGDVESTATVCTNGDRLTIATEPDGDGQPIQFEPSANTAAEVYIPGGGGAVVAEQPVPGASSSAVYLITDTGMKYPVTSKESLNALGYGQVPRQGVPTAVLALFPTGVTLDSAKARTTATS